MPHVHVHAPHELSETPGHTGPGADRAEHVLELLAILLLSLTTLATAWSGYQAARWSGEQSQNFARASTMRIRSQAQSTLAGQLITKYGRWKAYLVAGSLTMTVGMLLLSTIDAHTSVLTLALFMVVLGAGVGMLMQNLVLAAQNDVPAQELGATTSALTFFRSMGGAIGVSALGAVLAARVTAMLAERFGTPAAGGTAKVPDLATLPPEVLTGVREVYGEATALLFLVGTPIAALAVVAVLGIKEKPLHTLSGDERRAKEEAAAVITP